MTPQYQGNALSASRSDSSLETLASSSGILSHEQSFSARSADFARDEKLLVSCKTALPDSSAEFNQRKMPKEWDYLCKENLGIVRGKNFLVSSAMALAMSARSRMETPSVTLSRSRGVKAGAGAGAGAGTGARAGARAGAGAGAVETAST